MAVDLHLHSDRSDGTDPPTHVVELAARAGLTTLALTDHDTLDGIAEAREAAALHGVRLIPGTELSVEWPTGTMHMLVYFLEPGRGPLQDTLQGLRTARHDRNRRILGALAEVGIDITYEDVTERARGDVVGRPHIAAVLMERGHATDIADAFDRYLAKGRVGYVDRQRLAAREAIELARASGGLPVIAHPHTLGLSRHEFAASFTELASHGLAGIEAWYAEYDPELRTHLAGLADRLGLIATGGSDFHGRHKPALSVGSGRGDLEVPDSIVEQLDAAC